MPGSSAQSPRDTGSGSLISWRSGWLPITILLAVLAIAFGLLAADAAKGNAKAAEAIAKAAATEKWASVSVFATHGTYLAAVGNTVICLLLAATARWWHRPLPSLPPPPGQPPASRWFPLLLAAIVLMGGVLRWPLAGGGLWHDEVLQTTRVHGYHPIPKQEGSAAEPFRPAKWEETWFHYRKPTNHTVVGVPARFALDTWRSLTGQHREAFSERVLRLPTFLAALATVALVGWLGRSWFSPSAGLVAAGLLALHPWHIRWGVDLRAYSIGMFAATLAMAGLVSALRTGRWSGWAAFGLGQFLLLWSSLLHLFPAAALFLAAVIGLVTPRLRAHFRALAPRLLLANILAACLFLQVMGPNLLQFRHASTLRAPSDEDFMKWTSVTAADTATQLLTGLPDHVPVEPGDRPITTHQTRFAAAPAIGHLALALPALAALVGLVIAARRRPAVGLALLATAVGAALHIAATISANWYYYPRFLTYLLPVVVLAWAAAAGALIDRVPRRHALFTGLAAAFPIGLFLLLSFPQTANLFHYPHEPFPEIRDHLAAEAAAAPDNPPLTACYGLAGDIFQEVYDPGCRFLWTADGIRALLDQAARENRPLLVVYGLQSFNRRQVPDGFALLDDPSLFQPVMRFVGNDPRHTFFLLRHQPPAP